MIEPRTYPVGIVGEASYQSAIGRCLAGQQVQIIHELGNPYDKKALAVAIVDGETIGYIARDCWLRDAVHEEGHGCDATIKAISSGGAGTLGIVLDVAVAGNGVPTRQFARVEGATSAHSRASAPSAHPRAYSGQTKGFLARLFGL